VWATFLNYLTIFGQALTMLGAIVAAISSFMNNRKITAGRVKIDQTAATVENNTNVIKEIHVSLNGRLDELIALTKKASFAEGVKHEQAQNGNGNGGSKGGGGHA
jgi:hypothetical protein